MNPRRRRFLPKPEQPPEGMMHNPHPRLWKGDFVETWRIEDLCAGAQREYDECVKPDPNAVRKYGFTQLHDLSLTPWNQDPSYNWNRKHGRTRTPR